MKEAIKEELVPILRKQIERLQVLIDETVKQQKKLEDIIDELDDESLDDEMQKYDLGKSVTSDIIGKCLGIFEDGQDKLKELKKKYLKSLEPGK